MFFKTEKMYISMDFPLARMVNIRVRGFYHKEFQ